MNWYKVDHFPLSLNLGPLLKSLKQQGVACRVTEESAGQCLWLTDKQQAYELQQIIRHQGMETVISKLTQPESELDMHVQSAGRHFFWRKLFQFHNLGRAYPVTLLTLVLGVIGAMLIHYDHQLMWVSQLTFQPVRVIGHQLELSVAGAGFSHGEYWRLLTPIFLHFGLFHILFNGLWIWEFGRRIEHAFGSGVLLALIVVIGVLSNTAQYAWNGPSLFGGLSGVLYGLLGFLWIYCKFKPHPTLALPPGIVGFMLIWLALGMTGAIDFFIDGSIANAAHFGGLVAGMLLAFVLARSNQLAIRAAR